MTIDDILAELRVTAPPDGQPWQRFQAELLARRRDTQPSAIACARRILAATLVRAGVWLDRRAGERVLKPTTN